MKQPLVSVIIAAKNTADCIEACLDSIKQQTYPNVELIIVDNFSTDGTDTIAKKYTKKVYQIGPERSTQFNYGFTKSKGELIYRIGPDYVLEPDVIEQCVQKIQKGYDALALHNRSVGQSIWARVRYVERESYRNDRTIVAVRFMKRSVFESVGMFDESLVAGEDFDLHNRIVAAGYKWAHVDAIENHIGEPKNIVEVWSKFYYYGRTIGRYQKKNHAIARRQLRFFRPSFRALQRDLLHQPKLFVAFWFYMITKYSAGAAGRLRGAPKYMQKTPSTNFKTFNFPLHRKIRFYCTYVVSKTILIWFEVTKPKVEMFLYEMAYSLGKFVGKEPHLPRIATSTVIQTVYGTFAVRANTNDLICASPAFERADIRHLLKRARSYIDDGKQVLFLDIGADFGVYSVALGNHLKQNKQSIHIDAFEPVPTSYTLLTKNILNNKLTKIVHTHNFGLYKQKRASIDLHFSSKQPGSSGLITRKGTDETISIRVRTLDSVLALRPYNADVVILKLDVEGAETDVLRGASKLVSDSSVTKIFLVEDFIDQSIVMYLQSIGAKFLGKYTPYNSWWRLD